VGKNSWSGIPRHERPKILYFSNIVNLSRRICQRGRKRHLQKKTTFLSWGRSDH